MFYKIFKGYPISEQTSGTCLVTAQENDKDPCELDPKFGSTFVYLCLVVVPCGIHFDLNLFFSDETATDQNNSRYFFYSIAIAVCETNKSNCISKEVHRNRSVATGQLKHTSQKIVGFI